MKINALNLGSVLLLGSMSSMSSMSLATVDNPTTNVDNPALVELDENLGITEDGYIDLIPDEIIDAPATLTTVELAAIEPGAKTEVEDTTAFLGGVGFAPAYYILAYDRDVFETPDSVRLRSDGKLTTNGSKSASYIGLEAHWDLTWKTTTYIGTGLGKIPTGSKGHGFSPYVGVFDISDSINGFSIGALYSIWKGDENYENRTALNFGIGYFLHQNRYVLSKGLELNDVPPAELEQIDYTRKTDVEGVNIVISANIGF